MYKASCEAFLVSEDTLIDYESLEVGRYVHSVGRANNNSLSLDIMSSPNLYGDQILLTSSD